MKRFLHNLFAAWSRRRQAPRAARPRPPMRLNVEIMEDRLVPAEGLFSALPLSGGALLAASNAQVAPGSPSNPILPEKCVHGYKWRPPRPYPYSAEVGKPTAMAADPSLFTIVDSGPNKPAV
jgi:hypothetical protein